MQELTLDVDLPGLVPTSGDSSDGADGEHHDSQRPSPEGPGTATATESTPTPSEPS